MRNETLRQYLSDLLIDVPLARGRGDDDELLDTLFEAAFHYPFFSGAPSPVPEWIGEARRLSLALGEPTVTSMLDVRDAVVKMRGNDLDGALGRLDAAQRDLPDGNASVRCYAAATRSRVETRRHEFDRAEAALFQAMETPLDATDPIAVLPAVARGELLLEKGETNAARSTLGKALRSLPEDWIEERVQVLQSLGFAHVELREAKKALRFLDEARAVLGEAGIWSEVIQMNLVVASFEIAYGHPERADELLSEALELCDRHEQPTWEPLLQVGLARSRLSRGSASDAVEAALQAASSFARQGNLLGYVSMILYLSNIHLETGDLKQSYRVLALGVSIAKKLRLARAETLFRSQIDALRNDQMGPERFDAMVQEMIREAKGEG